MTSLYDLERLTKRNLLISYSRSSVIPAKLVLDLIGERESKDAETSENSFRYSLL